MKRLFFVCIALFISFGFLYSANDKSFHALYVKSMSDSTPTNNKPLNLPNQKDTVAYVLMGSAPEFQFLLNTLNKAEPTHKEISILSDWIRKNLRQIRLADSTTKK